MVDVSNVAVTAQKQIINGQSEVVTLHTESFGW
jgi:hypothetical protein